MNESVFSGFGIDIVRRDGHLFILFDAGGMSVDDREAEITQEEAEKAIRCEKDAYELLLSFERQGRPYRSIRA